MALRVFLYREDVRDGIINSQRAYVSVAETTSSLDRDGYCVS